MGFQSLQFVTPALVEGPKVAFFVPLPDSLQHLPFVMEYGQGHYGWPVSITVVTTWFLIFLLFLFIKVCTKKLEIIPEKPQILLESIYEFLDNLVEQMLGAWKVKYFSFLGSLFLFIFPANIISFFPIPWAKFAAGSVSIEPAFRTPTADLNTTVGLALLTTVIFVTASVKQNGLWGYIKGFFSPLPFMAPLNVVGELAKPLNISVRLFGNMFAGSVIIGLLYRACPWVIPAPLHLYFDLFSGLVQSFVFVTLSMVYIQSSLGDAEYLD